MFCAAVADNTWFSSSMEGNAAFHPYPAAPQCVPCNYPQERLNRLVQPKPRGCPCTPELICAADRTQTLNKPPKPCGMPRRGAAALVPAVVLKAEDQRMLRTLCACKCVFPSLI